MPRCLDCLKTLSSAEAVIMCLKQDPTDRVLVYSSDLTPHEFHDSLAVRTDDRVLIVRSVRESGAASLDQFIHVLRSEKPVQNSQPGEIAVIGSSDHRDRFGRKVPADVKALLGEAEDQEDPRSLQLAGGYEGIYVLADPVECDK